MGVDNATVELTALMQELEQELFALASPKKVAKIYSVCVENGYYRLENTGIILESNSINQLFRDVEYISVSAVTLGMAVDKKIEYYARTNAVKMLVLDALASVYVENIADELSRELTSEMNGLYPTVRFAAGYGDLGIELQPRIIELLDANKLLGITVGESNLMRPMKSMTGFQGFSKVRQPEFFECGNCHLNKCGGEDCPRRIYDK